jgi:hypothetical protein
MTTTRISRASTLALAAAAVALAAAPPAGAIVNGTPAPRNDRRLDCVGIVKSTGCWSSGVSGSCVLIDAGQRGPGGELVRGALVLTSDHSLARSWGNIRCRFRRAGNGDDDGLYPGIDTLSHCDGRYQEGGLRFVDGVARVTYPDPPAGSTGLGMALIELDTVITNIRPAIVDTTVPGTLPGNLPLVTAGWGATDLAGTQGMWALRVGAARLQSQAAVAAIACPGGCAASPTCAACTSLIITPDLGPADVTCTGLPSEHDSGCAVFRGVPNPNSDEAGGQDLLLVGVGNALPSIAGGARAYIPTPWLWNMSVSRTPPLPTGAQPARGGLSDFNRDGLVDVFDLFAFLNAWFNALPVADVAAPSGTDLADLYSFVHSWFLAR